MRRARRCSVFLGTVFLLAALAGGYSPGSAAPASRDTLRVEAAVAPAVVRVGERVAVRFAVAAPDSTARLIGPPAPIGFGEVDVVASGPAPAGPDSLGWALEVSLFQVGEHDLSLIPFDLESEGGTRPVRLLPYRISVETTLPDSLDGAGIRDIADPVDLAPRWRWPMVFAALLAAAALAAGLFWWIRRSRPETGPVRAAAPVVPPEVEARRALAALERDALPARGFIKDHYARLSLILRGYMERRYPVAAVESTTDEIRAALAGGNWFPAARRAEILDLFDEADLVKFARYDPGAPAADEALSRGRGWLDAVAAERSPVLPAAGLAEAAGESPRPAEPPATSEPDAVKGEDH